MNVPNSSNNSKTTSNIALENQIMINDLSNIVGAIPTDADVLQLTNDIASLNLDLINSYADVVLQVNDLSNTVASIPTNVNVSNLYSDIQALSSIVIFISGQQAGTASTMAAFNATQTTIISKVNDLSNTVASIEARVTALGG